MRQKRVINSIRTFFFFFFIYSLIFLVRRRSSNRVLLVEWEFSDRLLIEMGLVMSLD